MCGATYNLRLSPKEVDKVGKCDAVVNGKSPKAATSIHPYDYHYYFF